MAAGMLRELGHDSTCCSVARYWAVFACTCVRAGVSAATQLFTKSATLTFKEFAHSCCSDVCVGVCAFAGAVFEASLPPDLAAMYRQLAALLPSAPVPLVTVLQLWGITDPQEAQETVQIFVMQVRGAAC